MGVCDDPEVNCDVCFEVLIGDCLATITLSLGLTPSTLFFFRLIDKSGREYDFTATTDISGDFIIPKDQLPDDLITQFAGDFELQIFSDSGRTILVIVVQNSINYNCVLLVQQLSGQNQIPLPKNACQVLLDSLSESNLNTCILPDYDFSDTDVTDNLTAQQQTDLIALLCAALSSLTCLQLNDNITGLTITQRNFIQRVNPLKTGQTTSFHIGDDGDLEDGRGVDFLTLDCNNEFGNTLRFTNTIGTQDMTGIGGALVDYVIDHSTGLGWSRVINVATVWVFNIDNALADTRNGFSDWRLPNINELTTIIKRDLTTSRLLYTPFNVSVGLLDSSTTVAGSTPNRQVYSLLTGGIAARSKGATANSIYVRNHY